MNNIPFVSVIVPAHNAEATIGACLESLQQIDYPKERFEVIVVDNNSTDRTQEIIRQFPVILLEERQNRGSEAARNKGLTEARGDIFAFTDADCIIMPQWIKEGIGPILAGEADLTGGKIEMFFPHQRSYGGLYDFITGLRNDEYVRFKRIAVTANIFAGGYVLKKIGPFPQGVISGSDSTWCRRAEKAGFRLRYAERAVIRHPVRSLRGLCKKYIRVGSGFVPFWRDTSSSVFQLLYYCLRSPVPKPPWILRRYARSRGVVLSDRDTCLLWCVECVVSACKFLGVLSYLLQGARHAHEVH